jgi:hypothetical protein
MKLITTILAVLLITGCASSSTQYYEAVQKAAEANSRAAQAKFDALSAIAAAGDGQAASAAVMALALTQTPTANPIPQQSEAIQWASILASPVTSLGMMWMQADSAKTMARYNAQVDLASVAADAQTQQALYGSFSDISSAGFTAVGNVDYTPFIDGMVDLGTAGVNGAVTLGTVGMDNLVDMGTAGFDANTDIATVGVNGAVTLGTVGMDNLVTVGTAGMDNLVTVGTAGITATQNVGIAGMEGIYTNGLNWLNYSATRDVVWKDILATEQSGCIVTTNETGQIVVTCN